MDEIARSASKHARGRMRFKCLGCDSLARIIYLCAARSHHIVDVELFQLGLHFKPLDLRCRLQDRISAIDEDRYDAILLAYGLCGKAAEGLTAVKIPVVIPRAHDCITLLLGSRNRYQEQFEKYPGTYWYSADYLERNENSEKFLSLGADIWGNTDELYGQYVSKYGKENADYLMAVMGAWQNNYQRAVFIETEISDTVNAKILVKSEAVRRGWIFECISGDFTLIFRLLTGDWGNDFLLLEPGRQVKMSYNDDVIQSVKSEQTEN